MRKSIFMILAVPVILIGIVLVDNRNSGDMNIRQKILKTIYPFFSRLTRLSKTKDGTYTSGTPVEPPVPFHSLSASMNNGDTLQMSDLIGKMVLLVNTASDCGYTPQYEAIQTLYERYGSRLVVIGFPANDFKEQEKGTDAEIEAFCRINYGVTFPLAAKSSVVKGPAQNPVFRWLSDRSLNGWNDREPVWNFSKYLIDGSGHLVGYFEPSVDPNGREIGDLLDAKD